MVERDAAPLIGAAPLLRSAMKPDIGTAQEGRTRDTLDLAPRFTEHDAVRLNRMFRGSSTPEMLETVIRDRLAGDLAVVSSFGAPVHVRGAQWVAFYVNSNAKRVG